ncbi:hypothetical protein ACIPMW_25520 [Streptomyces sp. NPDC086669]|uniref:hypothetical protein n=1 Tax=Streptomyces sp. NPDC086669 TaxID=3365753 RepID=UPI00382FB8E1
MDTHTTTTRDAAVDATVPPVRDGRAEVARDTRLTAVLRQSATGAAAVAMLHAAVLGVFSHGEPYPDLVWLSTGDVMASLYVLLPWPLTALVLLWLANQRPALYARAAVALLLTSAAGLAHAAWTTLADLPAHEGSLLREYLALPGALTGWYLLTAVTTAVALPSPRARIAVATTGAGAVVTSVLTSADPLRAALFAVGVPLLAWWVAGRFPGYRTEPRRRQADAWDPRGRVVAARTPTRTRTATRTRTPVRCPVRRTAPTRQAG